MERALLRVDLGSCVCWLPCGVNGLAVKGQMRCLHILALSGVFACCLAKAMVGACAVEHRAGLV